MLRPSTPDATVESCIRFVRGSATEPRGIGARIIVQVVNDKTPNWGGAGFAQAVRTAMPRVQDDFKDWVRDRPQSFRLGKVRIASVSAEVSVASIIAQRSYGDSSSARIRYAALKEGLLAVLLEAKRQKASVHMPRIGTGHGGGRWQIVEDIVRSTLCDSDIPVTVYDLPGTDVTPKELDQIALPI
jgi:O-acetyl-ADP-ribose deacetylase (regulator of RNase III)